MNGQEKTDKEERTAGCAEYSSLPPLKLNPDDYREHVKEFDLTTDQENELLTTLWHIMSTFVDLGWGVDSVQMVLPEIFDKASTDVKEPVIQDENTQKFNLIANNSNGKDNNNG